jgi:hypothetical protein
MMNLSGWLAGWCSGFAAYMAVMLVIHWVRERQRHKRFLAEMERMEADIRERSRGFRAAWRRGR